MKRIGLTQRSHAVAGYGERRDMLDQRWTALIERLGACPLPLANSVCDVDDYLNELRLDALVLTGGNDIDTLPNAIDGAPERDRFEAAAYRHFLRGGKPVLGVCRGAQMINYLKGGRLVRKRGHSGTRHQLVWAPELPPHWDQRAEVNSYHVWAIPGDGLATDLQAVAWGGDGTIEAFSATGALVNGIAWHPEREADLSLAAVVFLTMALGL